MATVADEAGEDLQLPQHRTREAGKQQRVQRNFASDEIAFDWILPIFNPPIVRSKLRLSALPLISFQTHQGSYETEASRTTFRDDEMAIAL